MSHMLSRRSLLLLAAGTAALALPGWGVAARAASVVPDVNEVVPFTAYRKGSDQPAYKGEYRLRRQGTLVEEQHLYESLSGKPVLKVNAVFDLAHMRPVSYHSKSYRDGETIQANMEGDTLHYQIRARNGHVLEQGKKKDDGSLFLWPNVVHLVQRNWQPIMAGHPVNLELFIFERNAGYGFRLKKVGEETLDGQSATSLELDPSSIMVRLFIDPPRMVFSNTHPARLLEYDGRTAVSDEHGHNVALRIVMGTPRKG